MKIDSEVTMKQSSRKKVRIYKSRKKKNEGEDAAISFLQAKYDKINLEEIKTFKDFPLSQKTLKGLKDSNYTVPTEIQRESIGFSLQGKDILGAARTGSGKTLAFLIPILEKLFCKKWSRLDGVGALVISPTRELAYQIYETLRKIGYLHDFSAGLIIGGQNLKFERKRMDQINILICTPGRLLQHMDENPLFNCSNLQILVLDEADRCLDMGFETTMNAIIENLPPERQTLLFSATQTKSVRDLARLSLSFPTYVAPHEQAETVTPESLQQSYIICEIGDKLGILWSFIRNHLKQKILVFMSTCKQVKYIYDLFCKLRPGISLLALYGTLHQEKRENIYNEFCRKSNVVLFSTDLASRGLDFPRVNWVVQVDCPDNVDTYIHRAGRTARGVFGKGEGLLMLLPHEERLVEDMRKHKIPINKISVDPSKILAPQRKIESLLSDNNELKQTAQRAFVTYLKSIYLMKNKEIFNIQLIDTDAYAKSLGLIAPPRIKFMHKYQKHSGNKQESTDTEKDDVLNKLTLKSEDDEQSTGDEIDLRKQHGEDRKQVKKVIPKFHDYLETGDEFLKVKNEDVSIIDHKEEAELVSKKKTKPLTKTAVAKTILKNKLIVNTKVKFSETGETIEDDKKVVKSDLAKQCVNDNFNRSDTDKGKVMLREEDNHDKQRFRENVKAKHKEQKRKLKNKKKENEGYDDFGSQSESDGPDLSWLPDPDKLYNKDNESEEKTDLNNSGDENFVSHASDSNSLSDIDSNKKYHRPTKRKLLENKDASQESLKLRKMNKIQDISAALSVHEAEALAMQLLGKR